MSMVRQGRSPRDKFFRRTEGSDTTETDGSGRYMYFCQRVMKERFMRYETIMSILSRAETLNTYIHAS